MMTAFSFLGELACIVVLFEQFFCKNVNLRGNLCLIIFYRIMNIFNTSVTNFLVHFIT